MAIKIVQTVILESAVSALILFQHMYEYCVRTRYTVCLFNSPVLFLYSETKPQKIRYKPKTLPLCRFQQEKES